MNQYHSRGNTLASPLNADRKDKEHHDIFMLRAPNLLPLL